MKPSDLRAWYRLKRYNLQLSKQLYLQEIALIREHRRIHACIWETKHEKHYLQKVAQIDYVLRMM